MRIPSLSSSLASADHANAASPIVWIVPGMLTLSKPVLAKVQPPIERSPLPMDRLLSCQQLLNALLPSQVRLSGSTTAVTGVLAKADP